MTPYHSDDLTEIIEQWGDEFVVLESPDTAGCSPDYRERAWFATRKEAEASIGIGETDSR
jgi:hypothetical protein